MNRRDFLAISASLPIFGSLPKYEELYYDFIYLDVSRHNKISIDFDDTCSVVGYGYQINQDCKNHFIKYPNDIKPYRYYVVMINGLDKNNVSFNYDLSGLIKHYPTLVNGQVHSDKPIKVIADSIKFPYVRMFI